MNNQLCEKYSIAGRVAVITGTTRGIGKALAELLIDAGCDVVALDRSDNDDLARYSIGSVGRFKRIQVDLLKASVKELEKTIDAILSTGPGIDILVNSAGITRRGEVHEFDSADWEEVMRLNLTVPFHLSRIVSRHFIEKRKGKIINIASMLSCQGGLRVPSYTSSKHGIVGLTKSFSNGLAKYGINVNAIAPGFIRTDMTQPLQEDKDRNRSILARIPSERWGEPDDIKGALYFLASSMSDYVNGTVLPVDGGWLSS